MCLFRCWFSLGVWGLRVRVGLRAGASESPAIGTVVVKRVSVLQ